MNISLIKRFLGIMFFWGALLFGMTVANATVVTNGCGNANVSCTLQELVDGGTIIVNDKLFDNWIVDDFSTLLVDFNGISVTGLDDQPLNPGLQYDGGGQLVANDFDLIDLDIIFSVATLDGVARIKDVSLEIDDFEFAAGNVGGFIDIFEDVFDSFGGNLIAGPLVFAENLPLPASDLFDGASFSPQPSIFIESTILIGGDLTSLNQFTQRFSQIPEPPALAVLAMGCMLVGFARKNANVVPKY